MPWRALLSGGAAMHLLGPSKVAAPKTPMIASLIMDERTPIEDLRIVNPSIMRCRFFTFRTVMIASDATQGRIQDHAV